MLGVTDTKVSKVGERLGWEMKGKKGWRKAGGERYKG